MKSFEKLAFCVKLLPFLLKKDYFCRSNGSPVSGDDIFTAEILCVLLIAHQCHIPRQSPYDGHIRIIQHRKVVNIIMSGIWQKKKSQEEKERSVL